VSRFSRGPELDGLAQSQLRVHTELVPHDLLKMKTQGMANFPMAGFGYAALATTTSAQAQ